MNQDGRDTDCSLTSATPDWKSNALPEAGTTNMDRQNEQDIWVRPAILSILSIHIPTPCSLNLSLTKARYVCIVERQVRARRGRKALMRRKASGPYPYWQFCPILNRQKVTNGGPPPQKDVKNEGRSGYVYENKGSHDKLTEKMPGICA